MRKLYNPSDYLRVSGLPGVDPQREQYRNPFRKDYARLLHAPSFRRLQGKTQLFPGNESDFFRNRLTHSLEVAQIGSGLAEKLNADLQKLKASGKGDIELLDTTLIEFAGLAHDLGHPPFGHNGERALDEQMREYGGFEGNAQTLHILAHSEAKQIQDTSGKIRSDYGLDLCMRTLAAVLKYDAPIRLDRQAATKPDKGYYIAEQELVTKIKEHVAPGYTGKFKTVECQIMDLADDIAYSTYDLEDSLHAGFVTPLQLLNAVVNIPKVQEVALRKANDALKEYSYEPLMLKDLFEETARIFGDNWFEAKPPPDPPNASLILKQALANILHAVKDQSMRRNEYRTSFTARRVGELIDAVEIVYNDEHPALSKVRLARKALIQVELLKHLNYELVIASPRVAVVEYRGKELITEIFKALRTSKGALLPEHWKIKYAQADGLGDHSRQRVLCDFIANMTDRYAANFYSAIAGEGASVFMPI